QSHGALTMHMSSSWDRAYGLPVPPRSIAVAMLRKSEESDHEVATITRDIEVERVRRGIEAAEDRCGAGRARSRIDRARDPRELVFAQRPAAIVEHRHTIDSGPGFRPSLR